MGMGMEGSSEEVVSAIQTLGSERIALVGVTLWTVETERTRSCGHKRKTQHDARTWVT